MVIAFFTKTLLDIHKTMKPLAITQINYPDGRYVEETFFATPNEFSADKDQCNVRMGENYFRGDLEKYEIYLATENLCVDVILERQSVSWRPETGTSFFGDNEQDYFAWVVAVPYGLVHARIVDHRQKQVREWNGYHDHNWGNKLLPELIHHWHWVRTKIGDYVIIAADVISEQQYGYASIPIIMIVKNGEVIADDADKIQLFRSNSKINRMTGKPYSDVLKYIYRDDEIQYEITLRREKDIVTEPLTERITNRFKKTLAKLLTQDEAYHRFIGTASLEKRRVMK